MKYILAIVIALACIGGVWMYLRQPAQDPVQEELKQPVPSITSTEDPGDSPATRSSEKGPEEAPAPEVEMSFGVTEGGVKEAATLDMTVDENARTFTINAFSYGYDPKEIRVKQGETVTLTLTNTAGKHDWVIDEIEGARTPVLNAGETKTITFVAETAGTFEYYCSVGSHRAMGMVGKLVVEG